LNGGVLVPSDVAVIQSTLGKEKSHVTEGTARRSAAGPWSRTARWERPPGRPWASSNAPSVFGSAVQKNYEKELDAIHKAYPSTQLVHQGEGIWLISKSALLDGLRQHAIFVTGVSFAWSMVRSWAFWGDPLVTPLWIGPRHTNFFDGSICAYEPSDGTWVFGDSLVELTDLYTVWALRHLYLQSFGRWPGHQAVHHPIERILELHDDECCGCGTSGKLYGHCCKANDSARNRVADAVQFALSPPRCPPQSIVRVVRNGDIPPALCDVIP
jgi:hypothetical protein